MTQKVKTISVTTNREIIEEERQRLQKIRVDRPAWWADKSSSDWARREFGDNLDSPITDYTIETQGEGCQICVELLPLDAPMIELKFSFCDEYDCEMYICHKCLKGLSRKLGNYNAKMPKV